MSSDGPDFYDDAAVFATYMAHRERPSNPNDTIEAPIVDELLGDVRGARVLDLGCGAAAFGRQLMERGAAAYTGVEASAKMAAAARDALAGTGAVVEKRIEDFAYPAAAFDIVVSRLALHYVRDVGPIFSAVSRSLLAGGRFVFSVEHPVITSCSRGWIAGTQRQDWIVDDYFRTGAREVDWLGGRVTKLHRTIEEYYASIKAAGFVVDDLREGRPVRAAFADEDTFRRRCRIPLFLVMLARKPT
ncbi:MAG TPA: methyltransferase domain-containing protein [Polyangia bacterium]|nr:methyltransferase domain-containing protein [Polyangia bacterium]